MVSAYFLVKDRQFAASTRPGGLAIAERYGWTRDDYERTLREMNAEFPLVKPWVEADLPGDQPRTRMTRRVA